MADNDVGTASLLEALWRRSFRGRLVLASSMVVYGEGRYRCDEHGDVRPGPRTAADLDAGRFEPACPVAGCARPTRWAPVDEDAPVDPRNVYAATKLHQEHLCSLWGREAGATVVALRYHNVYGPRMPRDTPYAGVASLFRSALAAGRAPEVFEDGGQTRDFVHVRDVARANVLALTADGVEAGACNVASGTPHTVGELAVGPERGDRPRAGPGGERAVAAGRRPPRGRVARPGRPAPSASGPRSASTPAWPSSPVSPPPLSEADRGALAAAGGRVAVAGVAGVVLCARHRHRRPHPRLPMDDPRPRWPCGRWCGWSGWSAPSGLPRRTALAVVFVFAVALRLAALAGPPVLSDDLYRYAWDGRVQAAGIDPYRYPPDSRTWRRSASPGCGPTTSRLRRHRPPARVHPDQPAAGRAPSTRPWPRPGSPPSTG